MTDDARRVAFDPAAPGDERTDALAQIQQQHMPTSSDVISRGDIAPLIDWIKDQHDEQRMMAKAVKILPFPSRPESPKGMQSVYLDGMQIFARGDYFERPSPVGFDSLRMMVEQTPVLSAIIMTRIRQVQRFACIQDDKGPGFVIRHRDRNRELSKSDEAAVDALSLFMANCGSETNPRARKALKRDSFPQFLAKFVRESLTYDSAPIETEMLRDAKQGMSGFYALDGSTIRLCTDEGYEGDEEYIAVQAINGRVVSAYKNQDLIYEPRNPRADVRLGGYGLGETELLLRAVTGFLNAMMYNGKVFDDNSIPKGILHLTGEYSQQDLTAFRRYFNSMVRGINNAWTLPVMVSRDADSKVGFERIDVAPDEMHFSKWMTFLVSIMCAIYGMSPAEINFDSFTAGNTSALAGSDTGEKLAASRDSGLRPLLSYCESLFSDYIISSFSDDYLFRWTGFDEEDETQRHEMRKSVMTVNEVRAQENLMPLPKPLGDAPINPSLIGPWMQLTQSTEESGAEEDAPKPAAQDDDERPVAMKKALSDSFAGAVPWVVGV